MCKNTYIISFFLVACTLLLSQVRPILCEEDDSKPLMEDLNQFRLPIRELADTRTGDFPDQKKLAIFIRKSGGGSRSTRGGGPWSPGGGGSGSAGGSGSGSAGGGGSRTVIGVDAAGRGSKSGGSRISSSFNGGCILSIVVLLGFFL